METQLVSNGLQLNTTFTRTLVSQKYNSVTCHKKALRAILLKRVASALTSLAVVIVYNSK